MQAYAFTSRNIGWALGEARRRGVRVEVLADKEQTARNPRSLLHTLHSSRCPGLVRGALR